MTNPVRQNLIRGAVSNARSEGLPLDVATVSQFLPGPAARPGLKFMDAPLIEQPDFDLTADELKPWTVEFAEYPEPVRGMLVAAAVNKQAEPDCPREANLLDTAEPAKKRDHDRYLAEPEPEPELSPQQRHAAATVRLLELERQRVELRFALDAAIKKEISARHERDKTAYAFLAGFGPIMTPDQLIRQHLASEQQRRADKVASRRAPDERVFPSQIDITAKYSAGGSASDAVRKTFQNGGYRHGAMPGFMHGRTNYNPSRGPVPKLPSAR